MSRSDGVVRVHGSRVEGRVNSRKGTSRLGAAVNVIAGYRRAAGTPAEIHIVGNRLRNGYAGRRGAAWTGAALCRHHHRSGRHTGRCGVKTR